MTDKTIRSSKDDALTQAEIKILLAGCHDDLDELIVRLAAFRGLRISEIAHMRRSWIDFDEGTIKIPEKQNCSCRACRDTGGRWSPKSRAGARLLRITPELEPYLSRYFTSNEAIGRTRDTLYKRLQKIWERSPLVEKDRVYPHCLRASYCTDAAYKGMSSGSLKYICGWSDLGSAENYIMSDAHRAMREEESLESK